VSYRSFIDVLFILLLSAIVLLSQSTQIGELETAPARIGQGGISPIRAEEVRLVAVATDGLALDGQRFSRIERLDGALPPGAPVLLVTERADVAHQRVMEVWSALRERGRDVRLGVAPAREDPAEAPSADEGGE